MFILFILTMIPIIMTIRAVLIVTGAYKDPILNSFEVYGDEQIFSPLFSLIQWGLLVVYALLFWMLPTGMVVAIGIFFVIPMTWLREPFERILQKYHTQFRRLPHWYYDLVKRTDREERRRIAYMWLNLPSRTRMLYNAQDTYFRQWVDQVLMTMAS